MNAFLFSVVQSRTGDIVAGYFVRARKPCLKLEQKRATRATYIQHPSASAKPANSFSSR
jgi:hypothetical protein